MRRTHSWTEASRLTRTLAEGGLVARLVRTRLLHVQGVEEWRCRARPPSTPPPAVPAEVVFYPARMPLMLNAPLDDLLALVSGVRVDVGWLMEELHSLVSNAGVRCG